MGSLVVSLMLIAVACGAEVLDVPAGQPELATIERQIEVMHDLIRDLEAKKTENQERGVEMLYQTAKYRILTWTDYQAPSPQSVEELGPWYLKAMKDRDDFSPLELSNPWTHTWTDLRRQEHQLHDQYEELRVSLRRLERLRDRVRAQLGLPPSQGQK